MSQSSGSSRSTAAALSPHAQPPADATPWPVSSAAVTLPASVYVCTVGPAAAHSRSAPTLLLRYSCRPVSLVVSHAAVAAGRTFCRKQSASDQPCMKVQVGPPARMHGPAAAVWRSAAGKCAGARSRACTEPSAGAAAASCQASSADRSNRPCHCSGLQSQGARTLKLDGPRP